VEAVDPPGMVYTYSAQVAVEFSAPQAPWSAAMHEVNVVVRPAGPEDSLAAVPALAVVRLASGDAVFVRAGPGRYRLQWIATGPVTGGLVTVRDGLPVGSMVVIGGIEALSTVARDSIRARQSADARR